MKLKAHVVEVWLVRRPQAGFGDAGGDRGSRPVGQTHAGCKRAALRADRDGYILIRTRIRDTGFKAYGTVDFGRDADALDVALCHRFQPDGLPDARGTGVKDADRLLFPVLFATRNIAISWRVFGPHHNQVSRRKQGARDVAVERSVASFMSCHRGSVDPTPLRGNRRRRNAAECACLSNRARS